MQQQERKKRTTRGPEQYGLHQPQIHHWKLKNHKDDYTDLVSGFHFYTPIPAPYITDNNS